MTEFQKESFIRSTAEDFEKRQIARTFVLVNGAKTEAVG